MITQSYVVWEQTENTSCLLTRPYCNHLTPHHHVYHNYFKIHSSSILINNNSSSNSKAARLRRLHNGILNLTEYYQQGHDRVRWHQQYSLLFFLLTAGFLCCKNYPSLNLNMNRIVIAVSRQKRWPAARCIELHNDAHSKNIVIPVVNYLSSGHIPVSMPLYLEITFNPGWALWLEIVIKSREHPC